MDFIFKLSLLLSGKNLLHPGLRRCLKMFNELLERQAGVRTEYGEHVGDYCNRLAT